MELTITSKKLGRTLTFWRDEGSGSDTPGTLRRIFVDLNGKEGCLGVQLMRSCKDNPGCRASVESTEADFERVCRNWLRRYIKEQELLRAGEG